MSKQTGSANFTATTGLQAQHRMRRTERSLPRLLSRPSTVSDPRTGLDHALLVSILDEALAIGASFLASPATSTTTTTLVTKSSPTAPSTPDTEREDKTADENDESRSTNL
jgi:hypothetical protein